MTQRLFWQAPRVAAGHGVVQAGIVQSASNHEISTFISVSSSSGAGS